MSCLVRIELITKSARKARASKAAVFQLHRLSNKKPPSKGQLIFIRIAQYSQHRALDPSLLPGLSNFFRLCSGAILFLPKLEGTRCYIGAFSNIYESRAKICPGLNANEVKIPYDKHHKVSS